MLNDFRLTVRGSSVFAEVVQRRRCVVFERPQRAPSVASQGPHRARPDSRRGSHRVRSAVWLKTLPSFDAKTLSLGTLKAQDWHTGTMLPSAKQEVRSTDNKAVRYPSENAVRNPRHPVTKAAPTPQQGNLVHNGVARPRPDLGRPAQ